MGMPLADMWNCSLWEMNCAIIAWNKSQSGGKPTDDEQLEFYERMLVEQGYADE